VLDATGAETLSPTEQETLRVYERDFGIRRITYAVYPGPWNGYESDREEINVSTPALDLNYAPAATSVFPYLKTSNVLKLSNAYGYAATALSDGNSTSLVRLGTKSVAIKRIMWDGRENLNVTIEATAFNPVSWHLFPGFLRWASRGILVGEQKYYYAAQVDDIMGETLLHNGGGAAFRINGSEWIALSNWQRAQRNRPGSALKDFRYDMAFNGVGSAPNYFNDETLMTEIRKNHYEFRWLNHTMRHQNLNFTDYNTSYTELLENQRRGNELKFTQLFTTELVTPEISGLKNLNAMRAAADLGIRYAVSDTTQEPRIYMVTRHANQLDYNVSTPAEWIHYFANVKGLGTLTLNEILDITAEFIMVKIRTGDMSPHMFHQANFRIHDGTNSLLSQLNEKLAAAHEFVFQANCPFVCLTTSDLAVRMQQRDALRNSGLVATVHWPAKTLTLAVTSAARVPVTGLTHPSASNYGGVPIASLSVEPGQVQTLDVSGTLQ
jgi:hypothetical protein